MKEDEKNFYLCCSPGVMSVTGAPKVWADGDDPVPFIILPPGGDDGGGDAPLPWRIMLEGPDEPISILL